MAEQLLIIQHGEKQTGNVDPGLTSRGQRQADHAGRALDRDWAPPVGDSSRAAGERMLDAVWAARTAAARTAVIVSHGGATVDLLRTIAGDPMVNSLAPGVIAAGLPGGGITELTVAYGALSIVDIGRIEHIPVDDRTGHVPSSTPTGGPSGHR